MNDKSASKETQKTNTLIVNLYAGPGAGKSTSAWQIAAELKLKGLNAEYVSEYAKELVYDENFKLLDGSLQNQKIILDEQVKRLDRLIGKVDVIVTDAPLLLNTTYLKEKDSNHSSNVFDKYNSYNNTNIFINRINESKYEQRGRIQNLNESKQKDDEIKNLLLNNGFSFSECTKVTVQEQVSDIVNEFNKLNNKHINKDISKKFNNNLKTSILKKLEASTSPEKSKSSKANKVDLEVNM